MTQPVTPPRRTSMGLSADSFQSIRFSSPQRLFAADRLTELAASLGMAGAHGGMPDVSFEWARRARETKERFGAYLEIQTFLPRAGEDISVFEHAVQVAREAGASSLRVVCLLGRRYEMFESREGWREAVEGFHRQIALALPIVEKHRMRLGLTLDTGNNLSILDDPEETVEKLAPWTFNTHFKDMAVEEIDDGFMMSEVPLGEGILDLPRMVRAIRAARSDVHFSLEMITRDPLRVPCLTDKYWSSFGDEIPALDLARFLRRMRGSRPGAPLPRISGLSEQQRYALEVELVDRSIAYANATLGL
jgi:hypothetical protein